MSRQNARNRMLGARKALIVRERGDVRAALIKAAVEEDNSAMTNLEAARELTKVQRAMLATIAAQPDGAPNGPFNWATLSALRRRGFVDWRKHEATGEYREHILPAGRVALAHLQEK